jgi:hypothetical protein
MGRLRSILVAASAVAGLLGAVAPVAFQTAASADPAPIPASDWPALFGQAFTAVQAYDNAGPVVAMSGNSTPINTWLQTPSGRVAVNQSSELASDSDGTMLVGVSDLGEQQLVVDALDPDSGTGVTLVLQPATEDVASSHRLHPATANAGKDKGKGEGKGKNTGAGSTGVATPATAGGCYPTPTTPVVVGSVFGPLVQGTGIVSCPYSPESISLIADLYRWGASAGNSGGGSTYGTSLAINVFSACHASGANPYDTGELFSVNGYEQYGARSGTSWLGCN